MIPAESSLRFVASDPFGGGNLRSFWPSAELERRGWDSRCATTMPKAEQTSYSAVFIHRPLWQSYPDKVKRFHATGALVFCDEDDDLTRIHQTKNEIGLMEWVPGAVQAHDIAIAISDGVTVSSDALAEVYRPMNPNVYICRNALPREFLPIRSYIRDHKVRVGWAGITQTHRHDLEWIAPAWPQLIRGAVFSTIGDAKTPRMLGHQGEREIEEFVSKPHQLYKYMSRADIGIVPLLPCEFNEAKSWLKALEYMTVGVPVVATDLPEQRLLITHGENGFLAATPEEMAGFVQELVHDAELRSTMGKKAHERATELSLENTGGAWEDVLRKEDTDA